MLTMSSSTHGNPSLFEVAHHLSSSCTVMIALYYCLFHLLNQLFDLFPALLVFCGICKQTTYLVAVLISRVVPGCDLSVGGR